MNHKRRKNRRGPVDDSGFTLLEVMVALFLITVVAAGAARVLVGGLGATADQSRKQNAVAVATQAMEAVQAVPVSRVLTGRGQSDVQALLAQTDVAPYVLQDVVDTDNFDSSATTAAAAVVPLTRTVTLSGTAYTVRTAVDECWLSASARACTRAMPADGIAVLRATVVVSWGSCGSRCRYALSALLDRQDDPVFPLSTSRPVIVTANPGTVTSGSVVPIALTGNGFARGTRLSFTSAAGGAVNGVTVSSDGRQLTANWAVGTAPGTYTLALVNPDTGRAEYSPLTVLPKANDDCVVTSVGNNTNIDISVLANDVPASSGTLSITSGPSNSSLIASVQGSVIRVKTQTSSSFTTTLQYTVTVNGQTSAPATLTVHKGSGC